MDSSVWYRWETSGIGKSRRGEKVKGWVGVVLAYALHLYSSGVIRCGCRAEVQGLDTLISESLPMECASNTIKHQQ